MSIWKSPVFYFGLLLVTVVVAALLAPFVVNWNSYRVDLETYGRKLTGRDVRISGPIEVRLFPWPRLDASDVTIANAAAFGAGDFLTADKIAVQLSLAGLFSGSLDVEAVELDGPRLVILRDRQGSMNWAVMPDEALSKTGLLNRVKLDQIIVRNGSAWLEDEARGYSAAMTKMDVKLSAPAIDGPWKLSGTGLFRGEVINITMGSGDYETDKPLKLSARFLPEDTALPILTVDGEWTGQDYSGIMRLDPHEDTDQKQSAEGNLRPLKLQADIKASVDQIQFGKIRIAPADIKDSGTLIEGEGQLQLSRPAQLNLSLTSPRVNLDTLLGAGSLSQWRDGGLLSLANAVFQSTPANLIANVEMSVNVLTSGGDTLNTVTVKGSVDRQAIRINEASAALPGLSEARFDGVLFPGEGTAELGGRLEFLSGDFRTFLGWLAPEHKAAIDGAWKGSRGRVVLTTDADWTQSRFGMQNLKFELDGAPGNGEVAIRLGKVPGLDLKLSATRIDLDSMLPQGFSLWPSGQALALSDMFAPLIKGEDVSERHISVIADTVLLNGVTAKQAELDVTTSLSGVEIKSLRAGDIDGASFSISGLILKATDGPSGELKFGLLAKEPLGFLRLAGLIGKAEPPPWATNLGETALDVQVTASQAADGPELNLVAKGTSGTLALQGSGRLSQLASLPTSKLSFSGRLNSADGSDLARLAGMKILGADGTAGNATMTIDGNMSEGFATNLSAELLGVHATYVGQVRGSGPWLGLDGDARLESQSAQKLRQVLGLPFHGEQDGQLHASSHISSQGTVLKFENIAGAILGNTVAGSAELRESGELTGDFTADAVTLKDFLSWSLFDWNGKDVTLASSFAEARNDGRAVQLFLQPKSLDLGLGSTLKEAVIGFGANAQGVTVSLLQPGPDAQKLELALRPSGTSFDMSLNGKLQLEVAALTTTADGKPAASGTLYLDGDAKGEGRSPAAALASLSGNGRYWLENGKLNAVTLRGHAERITAATNQDALKVALNSLESSPGTEIGARMGTFALQNGAVTFTSFVPVNGDPSSVVNLSADLPGGTISLAASVGIPSRTDLPPVTITYSGSPGALSKRAATAALAAKLGYQLLAKDMAELEAVQKQQAALAAQEEAQRKEDEARFAAYQQQRDELRKRLRERRVFAAERAAQAAEYKAGLSKALEIGDALNRADLAAQIRRRAVRRNLSLSP